MSYAQIDISEVGPPEYPLIKVLRDTIFGEFDHRHATPFGDVIDGRQDVLALIAHLEGNPVGYKLGYRDRPGYYHSWTGGVLPDYRGQGIARRLQHWQHSTLRARGYHTVGFNSFNKFRAMVSFGLASNFVPDAVQIRPEGELSIHFTKNLTQPDPPPRERLPKADVHVESVGPTYHGLIAQMASETIEPVTEDEIDRDLTGPDPLALIAFVDHQPVGFKIGRGRDAKRRLYDSRLSGVLPDHRGRGVATALANHQAQVVQTLGYQTIRSHTRHDNLPQIRTLFQAGYDLAGLNFHAHRKLAVIVLQKSLPPAQQSP